MMRFTKNAKSLMATMKTAKMTTMAANTIKITFVDQEGNRATVPALVGQTLLEVALRNKVDIEGSCAGGGSPVQVKRTEDWTEYVYGEGPTCFHCHVKIPSSFNNVLDPVLDHEVEGLKDTWDDEFSTTSRLACMLILEKKHDGLVAFVPDAPPADII